MSSIKALEEEFKKRGLDVTPEERKELSKKYSIKDSYLKSLLSRWKKLARIANGELTLTPQHIQIVNAIYSISENRVGYVRKNKELLLPRFKWAELRKKLTSPDNGKLFQDKVLAERLQELVLFGILSKSKGYYSINAREFSGKVRNEMLRFSDLYGIKYCESNSITAASSRVSIYGLNSSVFCPTDANGRSISHFTKEYFKLKSSGVKPNDLFPDGRPIGLVPALEKILDLIVDAKLECRHKALETSFDRCVKGKKAGRAKSFVLKHKATLLSIVNHGDHNIDTIKELLSMLNPSLVFYRGYRITDVRLIDRLKNDIPLREEVAEFLNALIEENLDLYPTELFVFARSSPNRAITPELYRCYAESKRW
ncbi:MAG: hypothetical protein WCY41_04280 [Candidatus Micrarchaeia archaeon]